MSPPPLSALLSRALVAFTIELDNEFEHRMPHRTTDHGGTPGAPWAVSLSQWSNFMRLVDEDGITVGELARRSHARPHLSGMTRWGYVTVARDPADDRGRVPKRDQVVRPSGAGRRAREVWAGLPEEIAQRWRARFGAKRIGDLRAGLERLVIALEPGLPQWITFRYRGYAGLPVREDPPPRDGDAGELPVSALLSAPLQAFALEFERGADVSLCFSANLIRVLDGDQLRVAELPRHAGIAMPALRTALGILEKRGQVELAAGRGAGHGRVARLTDRGRTAARAYERLSVAVERTWEARYGESLIAGIRASLEAIVLGPDGRSPLWAGLEPPAGTWRTKIRPFPVLPDHPLPRQGGHPDGV